MASPSDLPSECHGTTYASLKDKIVLLTGIGQQGDPKMWGNGAATARIFIANGAKVFGCDLNLPSAESTQTRLIREFGEDCCSVMSADVTKASDVQNLVDSCVKKHGRIDVLVNNVGMSMKGDPASMDEETWDKQVDVNLKSVYLMTHLVLPIMEKQGKGSIVNISSIAGMRYIGKPQVAYSATKAAVIQFTKATAVIYAPKGVRLNVVVPGLMHTPLISSLADKYAGGDLEGLVKSRNEQVPMGSMGSPFDVANAVVFLASENAKYITGTQLVVDGAITCSTGGV
ncbi:putative ATP-dependent RNA helicase [Venturia nashicola]|uniref:Putative ATP-dependent RNA helicase n=1 Tax=Venturia nashicola TaxID=86259 RepID=A0A4Z1P797_9PEZI|nr:putative ATP-dependent RNA helicase [Venturia nashicola]TLD32056.1 putative ATP-dependent RNA helicase [Venturia nashicola]